MKSFTFLRFIRALNTYIWLKNCSQRQKIAQSGSKAAEHNQDKPTDSSRSLWVTCAAGGFVQALKCYEDASLPVDTSGWSAKAGDGK